MSKLADESWRNGYAPALSLVSPAASNPLLPLGPWLVSLESAPALMTGLGWLIIVVEGGIAAGLLAARTRSIAIGLGIGLHLTLLITHSAFFVQTVSLLTLMAWKINTPGSESSEPQHGS